MPVEVKVDRSEELRLLDAYTPEKVQRVLIEAARAGGMGPPSLGPGDRRIPWFFRRAQLLSVLDRYVNRA